MSTIIKIDALAIKGVIKSTFRPTLFLSCKILSIKDLTSESAIVSFKILYFELRYSKVVGAVIHRALECSVISLTNTTASVIMLHNVHTCFESIVISLTFSILYTNVMVLQYIFFTGVRIIISSSARVDLSLIILLVDVSTIGILHSDSSNVLFCSKSWKCYHIDKLKIIVVLFNILLFINNRLNYYIYIDYYKINYKYHFY